MTCQKRCSQLPSNCSFFRNSKRCPLTSLIAEALLSVFRYAVVFELVEDETIVVALAHTSRAPNYWLGRQA